jgi:hypothetical protein
MAAAPPPSAEHHHRQGYGQWLIGAGDMTVTQGGAMTMLAGK